MGETERQRKKRALCIFVCADAISYRTRTKVRLTEADAGYGSKDNVLSGLLCNVSDGRQSPIFSDGKSRTGPLPSLCLLRKNLVSRSAFVCGYP